MSCVRRRIICAAVFALMVSLLFANSAFAQAWGPPAGEGSVSFSYQYIDNTGHRLTDGTLVPAGTSTDMALYLEAEYGITDHLSISAGLPHVFAKYTDSGPPPSPIPYLPVDKCHCWHSGVQDFGFTARYALYHNGLAFTPSASAAVPAQSYNFRGEAALGRDLREVRLGIDLGQRLDRISPNLSVQGRYSYAFVERVMDIPDNRSNAAAEGTYIIRKRLATRGMVLWQRTHGGLRLGSMSGALMFPGEVDTPELLYQHDRLLRDNYWRAGGGLAYSFPQVDLFAYYIDYVSGTDTHAGRALTVGFSVPFRVGSRR